MNFAGRIPVRTSQDVRTPIKKTGAQGNPLIAAVDGIGKILRKSRKTRWEH